MLKLIHMQLCYVTVVLSDRRTGDLVYIDTKLPNCHSVIMRNLLNSILNSLKGVCIELDGRIVALSNYKILAVIYDNESSMYTARVWLDVHEE